MFESFFDKLSVWAEAFINLIVDIFNRMISFIADVVDWFKKKLNRIKTRIAYVITVIELKRKLKKAGMGSIINNPNVPTVSIPGLYGDDRKFSEGIAQVVYDEPNDKITDFRIIGNTEGGIDDGLRNAMKNEDMIKLG